jgi:glycosyltransferase involved in cell wall biosynthesis
MIDRALRNTVQGLNALDISRKTLDILIPTYRRPESAGEAIMSALTCKDQRFGVRCNSNAYEPSLEFYRTFDSRLTYSFFECNQGLNNNILYLVNSSSAKYCLLLSDEDRIDKGGLLELLDFLDSASDDIKIVSCSVWCPDTAHFYHRPKTLLSNKKLNARDFAILDLVSTYISGFIFDRDDLDRIGYKKYLDQFIGNSYFHLDISQNLLLNGKLCYFHPVCVLKGIDIEFGGDGHGHLTVPKTQNSSVLDLNPDVYGPYARAMQFFYRMQVYRSSRYEIGFCAYLLRSLSLFVQFSGAVLSSPRIVRLLENTSPISEMHRAADDWAGRVTKLTWFEKLFCSLTATGGVIRVISFKLMRLALSLTRKIYICWIWFSRHSMY